MNMSGKEYEHEQTQARSSSLRKLSLELNLEEQVPQSAKSRFICGDAQLGVDLTGFQVFKLECIIKFLQSFPCPSCFSSKELEDNFLVTEKLNSISSSLTLVCRSCKATINLSNDENINLCFQADMYGIGCHEKKGQRFLAAMDMPQHVSSTRASIFKDRI